MSSTNLSSRVGGLNPRWNEDASPELTQQRFLKAMDLTGGEFLESVEYFAKCWLPAREIVRKALKQRHEVRQSQKQEGAGWRQMVRYNGNGMMRCWMHSTSHAAGHTACYLLSMPVV